MHFSDNSKPITMKIKSFLLVGLLLIVASCNQSSIYSKNYDFPSNQWHKNNTNEFAFTIENDTQLYDITFSLSHVYGYQFNSLPLSFKWVKPDGTTETIPVDFKIKDEKGNELGDCSGDICDLHYVLASKVKLTKGGHKIFAMHSFQFEYIPNIIHIGMDVSAVK